MKRLTKLVDGVFGIDLRSLAAFRMGLGIVLLLDLWNRSRFLVAHYTDDGVLPWAEYYERIQQNDPWLAVRFSLHGLGGYWLQVALFIVAAVFAFSLLVGYRTRLVTVISWALLISLQWRNPLVLNGGDAMLRCIMFWAMFVPLGATASVDSWLRPLKRPRPQRVCTIATTALLLQVCLVYWCTAAFKTHPRWTYEFSAVYYALSLDMFTTRLGQTMLQYPGLLKLLTFSTIALEWLGPLVALCPFWRGWPRATAVFAFWSFHVGLALTMYLGMFPWIAVVAWIPFLPSCFWELLGSRVPAPRGMSILYVAARKRLRQMGRRLPVLRPLAPSLRLPWSLSVLVALLLVYVVLWNARELADKVVESRSLPKSLFAVGRGTGLAQRWSMFSPSPSVKDGWFVMKGELYDGSEVNLWQPGTPLPEAKPALPSSTYVHQRWRKYLRNIWKKRRQKQHLGYLANWLRWRWNRENAGRSPERRVKTVQILYQEEKTPPPGQPLPTPETFEFGTWHYD